MMRVSLTSASMQNDISFMFKTLNVFLRNKKVVQKNFESFNFEFQWSQTRASRPRTSKWARNGQTIGNSQSKSSELNLN